jgi:hypothetical protein
MPSALIFILSVFVSYIRYLSFEFLHVSNLLSSFIERSNSFIAYLRVTPL